MHEISELEIEFTSLLNKHSAENGSDTPDFILAQYMMSCLIAYNEAVNTRERWYGRNKKEAATVLEVLK